MSRIVWSNQALQDFSHAIHHLAKQNRQAATLVADRIEIAIGRLAETSIGRPGRVKGTYERVVLRTPYIIAYVISDQTLTILRIIHGKREWLEESWPTQDPSS